VLKAFDMRKWMRERLQRRKKKTAQESSEKAAPPPLQPAYFDAEQPVAPSEDAPGAAATGASEIADKNAGVPEASAPNEDQTEAPETGQSAATQSARQFGRGRRRRGGRGRGGAGREAPGREQAVAQAFAPKGAITPGAREPEEEIQPAELPEGAEAAAETPAPAVPARPAAPQRAPRGIVVLAIGLPGSGKSSWFKRHNVTPLSSDLMRTLLFDDVHEQRYQDLVFSNLRSMLKARLIAKRPMNYVDATNLTPKERQHWIKLAKDYNYEVHAVFFDVPLEVCVERHQRRDRVVPEDVMRRMAAKLKAPTFEEGFAKITVVRVKKKETGAE
jgi:predicted kinase